MHRINHHHLYIFWIFSKTNSFTKAANELAIAQSAVTSQIKSLENALNLELIDRTNPRFPEVTNEGKRVLEYAESIFEQTQELLNWAIKGEQSKKRVIRIGALSGLSRNLQFEFIKPIIGNSEIKIEVTTGDHHTLVQKLHSHEIDIFLSSYNIREKNIFSHVLKKSNLVFVKKKDNAKSFELKKMLEKYPLYLPGRNFEAKPELEAFLNKFDQNIKIAGEIDDIALLRIFALKSDAIVITPEIGVINEIEDGQLKVIHKITSIDQKFYAITKSKKIMNKDVELLVNLIN